jgi:putative oxidoreductase
MDCFLTVSEPADSTLQYHRRKAAFNQNPDGLATGFFLTNRINIVSYLWKEMKVLSLFLLRIANGLLMVLWGFDKLINPDHAMLVSNTFYHGLFSLKWLLMVFGVFQILFGLVVVLGLQRRFSYPLLLAINTFSMLAVWEMIVDPFGIVFESSTEFLRQGRKLFFPSLIIFAAVLVLMSFREDDKLSLDRMLNRRPTDS